MRFLRLLIVVFALPHIPARCYYYFWLYYVYTEELTILKNNWYTITVFEYVAYGIFALLPTVCIIYYYRTISNYIVKTEQKAKYVLPVFKKRQKCNRRAMRFLRLLIVVFAIPHIPARCYYYFWLYYVYTEELMMLKNNWYIFTVFEYVSYVFMLLTPVLKFVVYAVTIVGYRRFLLNIMTFGLFKNQIVTIFQRRPGTLSFHLRS